jgi:serine/threonine-protein kinase
LVPQTAEILVEGTQLAGFRIRSLIAEGGMGAVYLATQIRLDREVALKVLSAERSGDPQFEERFVRESKLAASLDHPNVLPVYDAGEADGVVYLAMRYVDGGDLRRLLREQGRLAAPVGLGITRQIALALEAAHAAGLVHRDVKPANILLGRSDHAYLADFGLARREDARGLTRTGVFMGTPDYAAPEQLEGVRAIDGRADVYSLGCVLYHCLAGQPPYVRESEVGVISAHLHDPVPLLSHVRPDLPEALSSLVERSMAKERDRRYRAAAEFATELGLVLRELGIEEAMPAHAPEGRAAPSFEAEEPAPRDLPRSTRTVLDRVEGQRRMPGTLGKARRRNIRPTLSRPSRKMMVTVAALVILGGAAAGIALMTGAGSAAQPPHRGHAVVTPTPPAVTRLSASDHTPAGRGFDRRIKVFFGLEASKRRTVTKIRYEARRRSGAIHAGVLHRASSPQFVTGLVNGNHYRLRIKACDQTACGAWSSWSKAEVPFGRPRPPHVKAKVRGQDVVFVWTRGRSDGRAITVYRLILNINGKRSTVIRRRPGILRVFVGYSGRASLTIRAVDSTHWLSRSSSARARTGTAPAPPPVQTTPSAPTTTQAPPPPPPPTTTTSF